MEDEMEYCNEHGEVEPITEFDSNVARCPVCSQATSTTAEEAARYEDQDSRYEERDRDEWKHEAAAAQRLK
jgi:hypothetical protein